jgi:hypothetical protein
MIAFGIPFIGSNTFANNAASRGRGIRIFVFDLSYCFILIPKTEN